jgi:hypothetical protein
MLFNPLFVGESQIVTQACNVDAVFVLFSPLRFWLGILHLDSLYGNGIGASEHETLLIFGTVLGKDSFDLWITTG